MVRVYVRLVESTAVLSRNWKELGYNADNYIIDDDGYCIVKLEGVTVATFPPGEWAGAEIRKE